MLSFWGVLLAGGAGGFTGLLIAESPAGGPKYRPEMLGQALPMTPRLTTLEVFCSGLALGFIFCVGIWFLVAATRRRHRTSAGWAVPGRDLAYVELRFVPPPSPRPVDERVRRLGAGGRSQRDDRGGRIAS